MKYKNFKEVPATALAGANKDLNSKLIDGAILFEELTAFLKMSKTKRNKIFGLTELETFIVKDLFGHRITGQVPQWMSDDFQSKVYNHSKDMVIEILEELPKLGEYVLPNNMNDSTIQANTKSKPMTMEEYYLARYMLIGKPNLGDKSKVYIFHVIIGGNVLALYLYWRSGEWRSFAYSFGHGGDWNRGYVFISLL